jgi:NADPH:quinone reductase-like Zn-dependent oxidoreductase
MGDPGSDTGDVADCMGSLFKSLRLAGGERLLIRGGTTSVGLAAAAIAKNHGAFVAATTRNPDRSELLRSNGAVDVIVDTGSIADEIQRIFPGGVDKVLEMIGTVALEDSLQCAKQGGIVCMTGIVGKKWSFDRFSPMEAIPTAAIGEITGLSAAFGLLRKDSRWMNWLPSPRSLVNARFSVLNFYALTLKTVGRRLGA